jgi:hypothetical protein
VNEWCFIWNDCVYSSLQMEKLMVEFVNSLVVLCGGNRDGSLLYLWVFVGFFHSVSLTGHLLTFMEPHPIVFGAMGCCVFFEPPFGHCIFFSPGHGLILRYWYPHSWL